MIELLHNKGGASDTNAQCSPFAARCSIKYLRRRVISVILPLSCLVYLLSLETRGVESTVLIQQKTRDPYTKLRLHGNESNVDPVQVARSSPTQTTPSQHTTPKVMGMAVGIERTSQTFPMSQLAQYGNKSYNDSMQIARTSSHKAMRDSHTTLLPRGNASRTDAVEVARHSPTLSPYSSPPRLITHNGRVQRVALCAILAQSEDHYVLEWVTYHFGLGIDLMLLVDNAAEGVPSLPTRLPQLQNCFGDAIQFVRDARKQQQHPTYNSCVRAVARLSDSSTEWWAAVIDADEFLVLKPGKTVAAFIIDALKRAPSPDSVGGIAVNWMFFGGQEKDSGATPWLHTPVTARFVHRQAQPDRHVKSFVRPSAVRIFVSAHCPKYHKGFRAIDAAGLTIRDPRACYFFNPPSPPAVAEGWLAHFHTKSLAEFKVGSDWHIPAS